VVTFDDDKDGEIAVKRMDNRAVENLILSVKPYMDKQDKRPRQAESLLSRRIYLMNVPYDASMEELDGLVSKFAPVDQVVVPRDK
jgi:RNA recognition motif-containing protein